MRSVGNAPPALRYNLNAKLLVGGSCKRAPCRLWLTKTLKSVGAITHPCRTPVLTMNERPTSPSTRTTASVPMCRSSGDMLTCVCTPYNLSTSHSAFRLMLS
eukprot:357980-Chlamydomonas_euryale.AAC.1